LDISAADRSLFRDLKNKDKNSDGMLSFFADGRHGTLAFPAAAAAAGGETAQTSSAVVVVIVLLLVR
jgi:hypothetical protein